MMTADRCEGATAKKAVPFASVVLDPGMKPNSRPRRNEVSDREAIRSVVLAGHKTSVSLEDAFWNSLKEIARTGNMSLPDLLTAIDSKRRHGPPCATMSATWRTTRSAANAGSRS